MHLRALSLAAMSCLAAGAGTANAPTESARPVVRPETGQSSFQVAMASPTQSLRPVLRSNSATAEPVAAKNPGFNKWVRGFRPRALRAGISETTFDRAFRGVQYDPEIIKRDRNQSEFTKTIGQYLTTAASDSRIKNGKAALRQHRRTLEAIERRYGVEKEVVVAVWGLESAYGKFRGDTPVIEALATLSYDGRRGAFFEQQLIAALKILQNGDTTPRNMTGSWAGAMGHTQFIPTSYQAFAVDFTGDGRRDIWSDDPTDALASTAAYLAKSGWKKGMPWGAEVTLPRGFNFAQANRKIKKSPDEWARLGVKGVQGIIPNHGPASILLPAGANGPALMIFSNFKSIERYNAADAYVIGVGHLSDQIGGKGPFRAKWPGSDRALTFKERKELQRRLTRAGFSTQKIDGKIGPLTIDAVRRYQQSQGLVPDGYVSYALLKHLR